MQSYNYKNNILVLSFENPYFIINININIFINKYLNFKLIKIFKYKTMGRALALHETMQCSGHPEHPHVALPELRVWPEANNNNKFKYYLFL